MKRFLRGWFGRIGVALALVVSLCALSRRFSRSAEAATLPRSTRTENAASGSGRSKSCQLDGTKCDGLLAATFLATPTRAELMRAYRAGNAKLGQGAIRWPIGACVSPKPCLPADTWITDDVQAFDVSKFPAGRAIVIGAIDWLADGRNDKGYGVGGNGEPNVDGRRTFIVVYHDPSMASQTRPYGTVIGRWMMFRKHRGDTTLDKPDSGSIVKCRNSHDGDTTAAGFLGCPPDHAIHNLAVQTGLSYGSLIASNGCGIGLVRENNVDACNQQRDQNWQVLLSKATRRLASPSTLSGPAALSDPSTDPYWFSCWLGCCIADFF
jgi:hypothetical protein